MALTSQRSVLLLTAVLMISLVAVSTGPAAAAAEPSLTISSAPERIGPDETFVVEYEIENTGADTGSFSLDVPAPTTGITVESITGDIQSSDTSSEPATASTDAAEPDGGTISFNVTYDANNVSTGDVVVELTARQPLDSTSDSASAAITIGELTATPEVSTTQEEATVRQTNSYEREYTITNTGSNPGSFTLTITDINDEITVKDITGEVQSTDLNATPPSATTSSLNASTSVSITIEYIVSKNATLGTYSLYTLTATQPIDNTTDSETSNTTIKEPEPEDPQQRATEIAEKEDPAELSQNDVTAAITRFDRGETANGIKIEQNDITILITLFERN